MRIFLDPAGDRAAAATRAVAEPGDGAVLCAAWEGNLLRDVPPEAWAGGAERLLAWSGNLGDDLFEAHPATWLRPGHEALAGACTRLAADLVAVGRRICLRPHGRHVLSDPASTLAFARERADEPFEVALDPAAMLVPSMLGDVEDHLRRSFEALGRVAALVILSDVVPGEDEEARLRRVPLGRGVLPAAVLRGLLRDHVPAETPLVIGAEAADEQVGWLTG